MESTEVRRYIGRQFSLRGLSLSKDALSYLTEQLKNYEKEQRQRTMTKVMELVEKENVPSGLLSLDILKEMLKVLSREKKNESEINFKLENDMEWRKELAADKSREPVECKVSPWEQLGFHTYVQRFELIKKLIEDDSSNIATIDSLLTCRDSCVQILAQLCRGDGSKFVAEDFTGKINLELAGATYEPGIYFEGGIFAFEGVCSANDNRFKVEKVKLPQLKSLTITDGQDGQEKMKKKNPNDRIVLLSDVLLDNSKVMRAIYNILQGFSNNPPNIFVLCGRFLSVQQAHGYTEKSTHAFRHLANILTQFSTNYQDTQFILVPSQEDAPPLTTFPCPSLPPNVQKCFNNAPNVHFATNPCRLIFKDQHIVIYRDDMVEKLCRSAMHMPRSAQAKTIPELFCNTIWSQRHLSPLPLFYNPILPQFDPLFQLWPAPDVLILADKFKTFVEADDDRRRLTINPGPFMTVNFEFQVYYPTLRRVDNSICALEETQ